MDIREIAETINEKAKDYQMGTFQDLRVKLHHDLNKKPLKNIFSYPKSVRNDPDDQYAFHYGGRHELQFNIGFIERDGEEKFRYGIALSLFENKSLPNYRELKPQFDLLTEYLKANKSKLSNYEMYYHDEIRDVRNFILIDELNERLFSVDFFIFFGKIIPRDEINIDDVLKTFDRLLEIYIYVEGTDEIKKDEKKIKSKSDIAKKAEKAFRKITAKTVESDLRHVKIQKRIFRIFCDIYGKENVSYEDTTKIGTNIDLVVDASEFLYYEIKTYPDIRFCIREAFGQLMEYAYWANEKYPDKLIIISENPITNDAKKYLKKLRTEMNLNIYYQQYDSDNNSLSSLY